MIEDATVTPESPIAVAVDGQVAPPPRLSPPRQVRTRPIQLRAAADDWVAPTIPGLQNRYGSSVLDEFVLGHTTSDVLTELVQNEFDAQGTELEIEISASRLRVTGNGRPIDAKGWKRLSVVLGTGETVGPDGDVETVPPKSNGIGSKNFGLRSLFLFGDRIFIRSGGKMTVKDRFAGSPPRPLADPSTTRARGVVIDVPLRDRPVGRLQPFTEEREREMLDRLVDHLKHTVVKLAQAGSRRNLARVTVTSERCNRRIVWTQSAKRLSKASAPVSVVQRTVRLRDSDLASGGGGRVLLEEIEFEQTAEVPEQHRGTEVPDYFRTGDRVRVGVSLELTRGRADPNKLGIFYYPLGVRGGYTGTAVGVKAPFQLDERRASLIDSDWNAWLLERAADLTMELLTQDWWSRFGPESLLVLRRVTGPIHARYLERVTERLKADPCWPTRASGEGGSTFKPAAQLVLPDRPDFDGFLNDERYLHASLVNGKVSDDLQVMARALGVKVFGLDSLVRLRCAGASDKNLETKVGNQANYHYTSYEAALRDSARQRRFAVALDSVRAQLNEKHKSDLAKTPSTLAADGALRAAKDLVRVDPSMGEACPVPASRRLHPLLVGFKAVADRCEAFEESRWATDVAQRAAVGMATEEEHEALYRYVLSKRGRLKRPVVAALRDAPILRDHRGEWVAPRNVIGARAVGAAELEPVLHFPHQDYASDRELAARLRFRRAVAGSDLVEMGRLVAREPERAEAFEATLQRRRSHLVGQTLATLQSVAFLRSTNGSLARPMDLYIRSPRMVAAVGPDAPYAAGSRMELYRLLGCTERPRSRDVLSFLEQLRHGGVAPERPEIIYPALVAALRAEAVPPTQHRAAPLVWTGQGYRAPDDILLGTRFSRGLLLAVPSIRSPEPLVEAVQALGGHTQPSPHHWAALFRWIGEKYQRSGGPVLLNEREALLDAYRRRGKSGLPDGVGAYTRCLLSRDRMVHSLADSAAGRYVINDDPALADAIASQGGRLAFAEVTDESREFLAALSVPLLSSVVRAPEPRLGARRPAPAWLRAELILERLHSEDFASALAALLGAHAHAGTRIGWVAASRIARQLGRIRSVEFVESIELVYAVRRAPVVVAKEVWSTEEGIALTWVTSRRDLTQLLADAIAQLIAPDAADRLRLTDAFFCLLTCRSSDEMRTYLTRRRIPWEPSRHDVAEEDDWETVADEPSVETRSVLADITSRVFDRAATTSPTPPMPVPASPPTNGRAPSPAEPAARTLPPLHQVTLRPLPTSEAWRPRDRQEGNSGGGGGGSWGVRSPADHDRDAELGRRGEALVFRAEQDRLRALGLDASRVVWTSDSNPTADHDIRSVDEDGGDLWIEVKSTVGRDGRFEWTVAEFEKAVREGHRYQLWRVYQADTESPQYKQFRDPVTLLRQQRLRLDIASFWAEVEPLSGG